MAGRLSQEIAPKMAQRRSPRPPVKGSARTKVRAILSYAHSDEKLRDELNKHLAALRRTTVIDIWYDQKIIPGDVSAEQSFVTWKTRTWYCF